MISSEYTVREDGRNDIASCDCCGNATITVWLQDARIDEIRNFWS